MGILISKLTFQIINTQHPQGPLNCKRTKSSSINQVCKFLLDLDPHWYFGKVVPPNYETALFGVNGAPKGGLGGNPVLTSVDHKEKLIL